MVKNKNFFNFLDQNALNRLDKVHLREQNLALLLRKIWSGHETTRANLARETGLSRSAVSTLVDLLLEMDLVEERGEGVSTGGRKPTVVKFNYQSKYVLGIDIGASHLGMLVTDLQGKHIIWLKRSCDVRAEPLNAIEVLKQMMKQTLEQAHIAFDDFLGVGIAVPSPVNPQKSNFLSPVFMPAWREIDLVEALSLPPNLPIMIDNDANMGALAETWWGAGQGCTHLAFIKLGTGVGAGFVIDGRIFRGHGGSAGELGHIVIDPDGPLCVCGLQGCLATFVGTKALLEQAQEQGYLGKAVLSEFLIALQEGDLSARTTIAKVAHQLGLAVSGLMNMMNPERVILGGDLALAGDVLLHPLRECIQSRSLWSALSGSKILTSSLGDTAIAQGAITSILQLALTQPSHCFKNWGR